MADPEDDALVTYVEELAGLFARDGLPLITGRIIGWLMVCEPAEQSAGEIAAAIAASKASLSTNLRLLTEGGLVRTVTRPGERVTYYRIDDDAWIQMFRRRMSALASFREVTAKGVRLLGADDPRSARVRDAHEAFSWLDTELAPLWRRWARRNEPREDSE